MKNGFYPKAGLGGFAAKRMAGALLGPASGEFPVSNIDFFRHFSLIIQGML